MTKPRPVTVRLSLEAVAMLDLMIADCRSQFDGPMFRQPTRKSMTCAAIIQCAKMRGLVK